MCSGCSGNYSGAYYDDGEYMANSDSGVPEEIAGPESCDALPEGDAGSLTSHPANSDFGELAESAIETPTLESDWQVYVSADKIIEIHFLRSGFQDGIAAEIERPAQRDQPIGNHPAAQQSRQPSANNYQTLHEQHFSGRSDCRIRLVQLGLGAIAAAILAAWGILH